MTQLEKDIERRLRREVEALGGLCLKWVCPGWSGVPDRIALLPGGRVYFIELKRPKGGKISKMQWYWQQRLAGLGLQHRFIWDEKTLENFIKSIGDATHETD